ncbi:TPA: deoxyribonuclease IV [Candidatus Dependentiae bacterium]|nr:deoxyribonuclease IV [Candidatus Dependentiae bacterium]HBZ72989.1 deoxyribonuclease IV [Candidatus Dependentiae bacterium]
MILIIKIYSNAKVIHKFNYLLLKKIYFYHTIKKYLKFNKKDLMKNILLGAHVSITGGFDKAILRGEEIGCTAIQIFLKSSRTWHAKKLTLQEIESFKAAQKNSSIKIVVAHCSYLINIASSSNDTEQKSVKALKQELEICNELGVPYLVLHPGSHLKAGEDVGIEKIAKNLDAVLENCDGKTMILLEIMAGQGTNIGYKFEQLKQIRHLCKHKNKVGICFDTCHAFSAGYDISTPKSYEKVWEEFDKILGLKNLKAIHLNDSKSPCGSKVDRHENIGNGTIPLKTFELIMNDKRFSDIPKILETPETSSGDNYPKEIKLLKSLIK